ncbi:hypothetical protein LWI29_031898 [Acer saccharum]|uniref:Phytocyanin domain-containing protein n=1 Tax=Acer saccharum TaxID=4024 RepID=A0AA39SY21_ACESA|nr:hypothetical protein LWI29_031898 [Acer saccharum]
MEVVLSHSSSSITHYTAENLCSGRKGKTEVKKKNEAEKHVSLLSLLCSIFLLLSAASMHGVEAVKEFKVGDDIGWQEPGNNNTSVYSQWAGKNRFHVGDSLSFEYMNDSVLLVEKWGYYHCNTSKDIIAFKNGKSSMKLDRPGPFYFISGMHLRSQQKWPEIAC